MADRSRRVSYAGLTLASAQPSRRLSYAGQDVCGIIVDNNERPSRRSSRHSDESVPCSQLSVLSAMDRFVTSVNNMDATVLVPSRLRDMDISKPLPLTVENSDLFTFYNMLKEVKNELLWGPSTFDGLPKPSTSATTTRHVRQPSNGSLGSTGSSSDQETDSEMDSLVTETATEQTHKLSCAFRHHMQGLFSILKELAESADYLTFLYQKEVDATSSP